MTVEKALPRPSLSPGKKLIFTGVILVLLLGLAELALRAVGLGPWTVGVVDIRVEPGGRLYQLDDVCGYTYLPGRFTVTLPTGWTFHVTHKSDTLRVTGPNGEASSTNRIGENGGDTAEPARETWVFGCSYTYGWTVNDEETYVWKLQESHPDQRFVNFGVDGYGTAHSLVQLRNALAERPQPDVVVLAYCDFHDMRNTLRRQQQKNLISVNKLGPLVQPAAWLDDEGRLRLEMRRVEFRPWPLMGYSALVHTLERIYDKWDLSSVPNHEITLALIREFARECEARGAKFVLAGIRPTPLTLDTLRVFAEGGVSTVDISVDPNIPENTNLPHDGHPSAVANRQFAEKLGSFLDQLDLSPAATNPNGTASVTGATE